MTSIIKREQVLSCVSVILRVPALFIMEGWCRVDANSVLHTLSTDKGTVFAVIYYLVLLFPVSIALLPLRKLVSLYMYFISGILLFLASHISLLYVELEQDAAYRKMKQKESLHRGMIAGSVLLVLQYVIGALLAYLLDIKDWKKHLLLTFTLPVLGGMCGIPASGIEILHEFAKYFFITMGSLFIFNNADKILDSAKDQIRKGYLLSQVLGYIPFCLTLWHTMLLPVQLLLFWFIMFSLQFYLYFYGNTLPISIYQEGWLFVILAAIGECCATPVSLFALCVTISYISYYILTLTKLFIQGWQGYQPDAESMRGWTEGFTMLLIAMQTGLLDLKPLQRAFLMSILLFIVASSLIQSMYEMCDPILLALSAAHNKSISKHVRAVLLFTFLWIFPLYMTYSICQYFDLDFWLLVIMSSCLLTSVQVMGSLIVYALFMYDSLRSDPWDLLDDVIYYVRSAVRILEFIVAVFVVCYGVKESIVGEWSWINSSILLIHCYFNVWQRLQTGWKTFLLRREAVQRLESLPIANDQELEDNNDVCPICYQSMSLARITKCKHFFHGSCLKKWLYVKDTCPMCHKKIDQPEVDDSVSEDNPNIAQQENNQNDSSDTENEPFEEFDESEVTTDGSDIERNEEELEIQN